MPIWEDLLSIENRLETEGDTKSVRRAFWRIVGRIKRLSPAEVSNEEIKKAAEIRNRLFKQPVILSVRTGLLLFSFIFILCFAAFLWVLLFFPFDILWLNAILLLLGLLILYGIYPLGRYLGGVIAGVKFDGFYRFSPAEFGLKIEYISYLKAKASRRKWVFGIPVFWIGGFILLQISAAWLFNPNGIWAPLIFFLGFSIFYYWLHRVKRTGELHRYIRELRIAKEVKQKMK